MSRETDRRREDYRCPQCGRFISPDTDGFFDRKDRENECSEVLCFCNEKHADAFHAAKLSGKAVTP